MAIEFDFSALTDVELEALRVDVVAGFSPATRSKSYLIGARSLVRPTLKELSDLLTMISKELRRRYSSDNSGIDLGDFGGQRVNGTRGCFDFTC